MTARLIAAATLWLLFAVIAAAQVPAGPGGPPRAEAAAPQPAADAAGSSPAARLAALLRDDAARAALIAELERAAAAVAGAAEAAAAPAPPADSPFVERLVGVTRAALREAVDIAVAFWNGLTATWRRLGGLGSERSATLVSAARSLALVVVVTIGVHQLLRVPARAAARRLGAAAEGAGPLRRVWRAALAATADLLTIGLAYVAGIVAAIATLGQANDGDAGLESLRQAAADNPELAALDAHLSLYLNAFLVTNLVRAAIRLALAPDSAAALRLPPFTDAGARAWTRRLGLLASILGYGLILVAPMVASTVSVITGRAVEVTVYALATIYAIYLTVRHRHGPARWLALQAPDEGGDATLKLGRLVAPIWHWPVLAWLVAVFVVAVSRSGAVEPILSATGRALGAAAAGAALVALLGRLASRGVRLPDDWTRSLPALEGRINAFIDRFLGALRLLVTIATIAVALTVGGLVDVIGLVDRTFGEHFREAVASVMVFVAIAFAIWLAMASWVDYRLKPDHPTPATPREQTLLTLFRNAASIAIIVITAMSSLSELGFDIAPLLASAGVLGLAIGFGAQKLVQDIITGLFIQLENAINVGDVVTVAGVTGTVEKLTIRCVSLRDLDGTFHIVPFSSVSMVSNFMRGHAFHVAVIGVAYREDVEVAKRLMHEAFDALKADREFARSIIGPLEWHGVIGFGPNSVDLRARIRTRPGAQWAVGRAYNALVKRKFDENGVEIPFPQQTIWFGDERPGKGARRLKGETGDATPSEPARAAGG